MTTTRSGMIRGLLAALDRRPGWTIVGALVLVTLLTWDVPRRELDHARFELPVVELVPREQREPLARALYLGVTRLLPAEQRADVERALSSVERLRARTARLLSEPGEPSRLIHVFGFAPAARWDLPLCPCG